MTVFRNDDRWDRSNVAVRRTAASSATTRRDRRPTMRHIDYGLGVLDARRVRPRRPARRAVRSGRRLPDARWPAASWPATRCTSASTRSDRRPGLEETRAAIWHAERADDDELRASSTWTRRREILGRLDADADRARWPTLLADARERGGRLFFLGVGGSAGNCSHAVNDFRKLAGFEAYAPTDNVSELTARTNDEGWDTVFADWLKGSRLRARRHACSCSRSAAAASRRTSARTSCARCSTRKQVGATHRRRGRPRRRLHGAGGRRVRDRADGQPRDRDAARRGVSGGRLAPAGLAPAAEGAARRSGSRRGEPAAPSSSTATACSTARSCATASPIRRDASTSWRSCRACRTALRAAAARPASRSSSSPTSPTSRAARRRARGRRGDQRGACVGAAARRVPRLLPRRRRRLRLPQAEARPAAASRRVYDRSGRSFMVGDRWRDIEAGRRAGCARRSSIDYGYDERAADRARCRGSTSLARGGRLDSRHD